MSEHEIETLGHEYLIKEPRGKAAMEMHGRAMEAMHLRGAMDVFLQTANAEPDELGQMNLSMAWRIAASPEGRATVKAMLLGSTVDGVRITRANYAEIYSESRHAEPYLVALEAWNAFRFFTVTAASKSEPSKPEPDPVVPVPSGSV